METSALILTFVVLPPTALLLALWASTGSWFSGSRRPEEPEPRHEAPATPEATSESASASESLSEEAPMPEQDGTREGRGARPRTERAAHPRLQDDVRWMVSNSRAVLGDALDTALDAAAGLLPFRTAPTSSGQEPAPAPAPGVPAPGPPAALPPAPRAPELPSGWRPAPEPTPRPAPEPEPTPEPPPAPAPEPAAGPGTVYRAAAATAAARESDTLALGTGYRAVVTAATWLRPDGYVEWDGALCRARWRGPATAYPRPGDLVRVTAAPDTDPPLLIASPLH
ncbi:hypothetical protein KV205_14095 [Streptomyces sp. SKN60]|uniref:hypothetical protein n=1 Tax=Streptomyces sp. SKN60 TaxID=2855506 RepID=UPI00224854AF|nr:hypothetical protein [Streptomyces sp. SKN60]MCX2181653.1 hypothetical protein [Streptomyces sp. SKN60]